MQNVSEHKIQSALKGMDDNKASRSNDLNSFFFKKVWEIIKINVIDAQTFEPH